MRLGCRGRKLGALFLALWRPPHTPSAYHGHRGSSWHVRQGECRRVRPHPDPEEPPASDGCQMLAEHLLALASQAD